MDTQDLLNKEVGNIDIPKGTVDAKPVVIMDVIIKEKKADGTAMATPMVQFLVKHPDKEDNMTMSKIKYIDGDKAITKGFWIQTDKDKNFYKGSSVDLFLQKLSCKTLKETIGKIVETVTESDKSPYLCFKLY